MISLNVVRLLAEEHHGGAPRARLVVVEEAVPKAVYRNGTLLRPSTRGWGGLALVGKAERRLAVAGAIPDLPGRRVLAQVGAAHQSEGVRATRGSRLGQNSTSNGEQRCSGCHAAAARPDNPVDRVESDVSAGLVHEAVGEILAVAEPLWHGRAGVGSETKLHVCFDENGARPTVWKLNSVTIDYSRNIDPERVLTTVTEYGIRCIVG